MWSFLKDFEGIDGKERIKILCDYSGINLNDYSKKDLKKAESKADNIPYHRLLSQDFFNHQAYYFDKAKIWWLWNRDNLVWEIVDETDIFIAFENYFPDEDTSISSVKNRLLEEFRKIGRKNEPKKPKISWLQFKDTIIDYKNPDTKIIPESRFFMKNILPWNIELNTDIEYLKLSDKKEILDKSDTPYIDNLFIEWVGKKYLKTLYEIIGFAMLREYKLNRIICLLGEGANGKSSFIRLLEKVIGINNYTSSDLKRLSMSGFESSKLYGKLICTINEIDRTVFSQSAFLKRLTGGDLISFEMKFKKPFDDYNYAKIIIAANKLPETTDGSLGFFRRWLIIDFPNIFEEGKDPVLSIPDDEIPKLCGKAVKLIPLLLQKGRFSNERKFNTGNSPVSQ